MPNPADLFFVPRIRELSTKCLTGLFINTTECRIDIAPSSADDKVRIAQSVNGNARTLTEFLPV
jgi:hypothetical protein